MFRAVAVVRQGASLAVRRPAAVRAVAARRFYSAEELSDSEFDAKWKNFFDEAPDSLTLRKGLNDVFAHDLVPEPTVLEAALRASRRVNDFSTSVRIFEGVKDKAQSDETYKFVVGQLQPVIDELKLSLPEELGLA